LNQKLFREFNDNKLHSVRKPIKKLMHLLHILSNKDFFEKIKVYDELQNRIGTWHDKVLLIELLKKNKSGIYTDVIKKLQQGSSLDLKSIKSQMELVKNSCFLIE
ncbi:MAG TPA: CHAD domain-containing protein, partial [Bacteroidia bacterium]|nr:CHAD domain-containing protein [Bacteroidia bacterium]